MITIDASVLVAAGAPDDPGRADAMAFLAVAVRADSPIHQPTITLVEVAAAIARRTGDAELAREAGIALLSMPGLVLHPLDLDTSADSAALAARLRLRGADAIYAATALRHGSTLVSFDGELHDRSSSVLDVVTPVEWLARKGREVDG